MDVKEKLPFKIGDEAEAKSFLTGFRSAWFRCKIKDISVKRGQLGYDLEFFDYPDEKITWTRVYQVPQHLRRTKSKGAEELMLRPKYPPKHFEGDLPNLESIDEEILVVKGPWKVGDSVDWWNNGAHWCGKIIHTNHDKFVIALPEPPVGEGRTYDYAVATELRPSLHWSPDCGWTVLMSGDSKTQWYKGYLIHPHNAECSLLDFCLEGTITNRKPLLDLKGDVNGGTQTQTPICGQEATDAGEQTKKDGLKAKKDKIPARLDSFLDKNVNRELICMRKAVSTHTQAGNRLNSMPANDGAEEVWKAKQDPASASGNSTVPVTDLDMAWLDDCHSVIKHPDTVDSAIMQLEELGNKVKLIKDLVRGIAGCPAVASPSWVLTDDAQHCNQR